MTPATPEDLNGIRPYVEKFAVEFGVDANALLNHPFVKVEPVSAQPFRGAFSAQLI
jgi:hypothetical protein